MGTCIYTKTPFENANAEHILQNFLGANWASREIVCNDLQTTFGTTIDKELEDGFKEIRNLLGTKGGRGGAGPTLKGIETSAGEKIDMQPGGKPRLAAPIVKVEQNQDGKKTIRMTLGHKNQMEWAKSVVEKQYPNLKLDLEQIAAAAQSVQGHLSGKIPLKIGIGGSGYFRGLLKSCFNLFGVANHSAALSQECDPIRLFIKDNTGNIEDFVRWIPDPNALTIPRIGRADHFIAIASVRGGIEGIVQLFGEIKHSFRIASKYIGPDFKYSYLVDPFRASPELRHTKFLETAIPDFSKQHSKPSSALWAEHTASIGRIAQVYFDLLAKDPKA